MKVMFLDESGDHNLAVIDPQYPVFVLAGVVIELSYLEELNQRVREYKLNLFGDTRLLHTMDIVRERKGFERLKDAAFRHRFYEETNALLRSLEFQVIACAIKKDQHLRRYTVKAIDPYLLSLHVLVERLCFEVGDKAAGAIILAEARNPLLDGQLKLAWENLKSTGTEYLSGRTIAYRVANLMPLPKGGSTEGFRAGLELADLVATPIGRHVLGKRTTEDFRIVESKLRRWRGTYEGAGLVILPKE